MKKLLFALLLAIPCFSYTTTPVLPSHYDTCEALGGVWVAGWGLCLTHAQLQLLISLGIILHF